MAAGPDIPTPAGPHVSTATLSRRGHIDSMAPEYPLERICAHRYEPFQLKFARHAQQILEHAKDVQLEATHAGLVLCAETEAALEDPIGVLREFYGSQVAIGPATIRYHRGVTLEQPYMGVRVRCGAADFAAVKADLLARGGIIVDSELTRSFGVVRVIAPLARLLGYSDHLARLTAGTGREVMWLSHYAPVEEPPPSDDVA